MSDAVARFENLGVDFDLLTRRRDMPNGINENYDELRMVMQPAFSPESQEFKTLADRSDASQALRENIVNLTKFARKQAMVSIHPEYSRQYSDADDRDVMLVGERAFAWIVANQVLNNVSPEVAAENADQALTALSEEEAAPSVLISGESDTSMIVTGVKLGQIALEAQLGDIHHDTLGVVGNKQNAYARGRIGSRKWGAVGSSIVEDGIMLAQYPKDFFEPIDRIKTHSHGPATKFLVTPQAVSTYLDYAGEFRRSPELAISLAGDGAIQLADHKYMLLKAQTNSAFRIYLSALADRAIKKATNSHGPLRNYGEYQMLVDVALSSDSAGAPERQAVLKQQILETMKAEASPPFHIPGIAALLRKRGGGPELARRAFRKYVARLNYAVALLPIDDAQENVPQNPEFAEVALINAEIHANNAQTEGIISTGDRRRIQRVINAERKALAKRSN